MNLFLRAAAAFAVGVLLAACAPSAAQDDGGVASIDGAGTGATDAATEASSEDVEEQLLDYVQCLRDQGLDIRDPQVDSEGNIQLGGGPGGGDDNEPPDPEAFEAAQEVCGEIPQGAFGGFQPQDNAAFQDAAYQFSECLRDHGLDVPDPQFGEPGEGGPGGGGGVFGGALDPEDPTVAAAMEECQSVFTDAGIEAPGGVPAGAEAPAAAAPGDAS